MNLRHAFTAALIALGGQAVAVDTGPSRDELVERARAAIEDGQYDAAIPPLLRALSALPRDADVLNLLGYTNRKLGALDAAAEYYARALVANPGHLGALEYQGELFILQGDRAAAQSNLARLTDLCGTCPEAAALEAALSGADLDSAAFGADD